MARHGAWDIAKQAHWDTFVNNYFDAFEKALGNAANACPVQAAASRECIVRDTVRLRPEARNPKRRISGPSHASVHGSCADARRTQRHSSSCLEPVVDMAPLSGGLFRSLSPELWTQMRHNPLKVLEALLQTVIDQHMQNPEFIGRMREVISNFDAYMGDREAIHTTTPALPTCAWEYGLHESMPFYSGGLRCWRAIL